MELSFVRRPLDSLAEHAFGGIVSAHTVVEIRQVGAGGKEVGIHPKRRPVGLLRQLGLSEVGVKHGQVQMAAGHVRHRQLRLPVLGERRLEGAALGRVEAIGR